MLSTVKKGDPFPPPRPHSTKNDMLPGRAVDQEGIQESAGVQDSPGSKKQIKKFPSRAKSFVSKY